MILKKPTSPCPVRKREILSVEHIIGGSVSRATIKRILDEHALQLIKAIFQWKRISSIVQISYLNKAVEIAIQKNLLIKRSEL